MEIKRLSDLEQEVMNLIWAKSPSSIKDLKSILDKKKTLAYTTVATIVQRLEKKGMIKRCKCDCDCTCIAYSPAITKEKYLKGITHTFIDTFEKSFGDAAIASFADSVGSLSKEKRQYFLKLLDEHETK